VEKFLQSTDKQIKIQISLIEVVQEAVITINHTIEVVVLQSIEVVEPVLLDLHLEEVHEEALVVVVQ
jgi:hypothetical protein